MKFSTLFFDLDDTVYPHTSGLWEEIRHRMDIYLHERLNFTWDDIPKLRQSYLETYGTTLRGLQNRLNIDAQDFLAFVHDIPVHQYLRVNFKLKQILVSLPQKRWIFTNSDKAHACRVLAALDLMDCFEGIIDVNALDFVPKPDPIAFKKVLTLAGVNAESSVFFDDAARNLGVAVELGFTTVLVGPKSPSPEQDFHYHVHRLEELPQTLPWLWDNLN